MRESTLDYSDPIPCQLHAGCKSTVCIQATSLEAPRLQVKRCPDTPLVISTHYQVFGRVKSRRTIKFQRQRFGYAFGYVETKNAPKGTFFIIALAERVGFAYIPQAAVWLASQTLRILHAKSAGTSLLSAQKNAPYGACVLAERVGFEPTVPCGTPDFESGTFDHSATSPGRKRCGHFRKRRIVADSLWHLHATRPCDSDNQAFSTFNPPI